MTQKFEQALLSLLLILLPSQLALHFWPSWSLINGIRVDYLSPTVYITDLIIFGLFICSRLRIRVPMGIIIFVVLNTLNSTLPLLTIYKWFRILEYFWLFKYLLKKNLALSTWPLALAVIWTSVLAWWQFFLQHSVGGFWWFLGERPLSAAMLGIAKVALGFGAWDLGLILRPYATLPHPNALAGFLLVAALVILSITPRPPLNLRGGVRRTRVICWSAIFFAFLTVPLTFSRTAIVLEIVILLFWLRPVILKFVLLISNIYFLVSISGSVGSFSDRLSLIHNSIFLILKHPVLGVGLGNFIPATGLFQPVHNIYLLIASELGLPAFLFIGYWIIENSLKIKNLKLKIALAVVFATGALDHYWITLHQNSLLLVLLLSLLYAKPNKRLL